MPDDKITASKVPAGTVTIYEFGCRLDKESQDSANEQIILARRLYNNIVALMRQIYDEMQSFIMAQAGEEAATIKTNIDRLNDAFSEAKAKDDESEMKRIATLRREQWKALSPIMDAARKTNKKEIQQRFFSRIGLNSSCETYKLRSEAVTQGLGWGTANQVLDSALQAFSKSMKFGRAPQFTVGTDKVQDTLTLQFTEKGGATASTLLEGKRNDFKLIAENGFGRRKYGQFSFLLGAARNKDYANGSWQYHRPIPEDAAIGIARLIRRKVGPHYKWSIQIQVKPSEKISDGKVQDPRERLATIHMGWAQNTTGRKIAGVADGPDADHAKMLQLPPEIEQNLAKAAEIQGLRDEKRNVIVARLKKEIEIPDTADESLIEQMKWLRRVRTEYVSANKLHRIFTLLKDANLVPHWLSEWHDTDKIAWQSHTSIARRARNARKTFYRTFAINLCRHYQAIGIEPLDLAKSAKKVDEVSGEKGEFGRKARSGRVVAALYELESALKWAAVKCNTAVLNVQAKTVQTCAICNSTLVSESENRGFHCAACGTEIDRKLNGAIIAWKTIMGDYEQYVENYWICVTDAAQKNAEKSAVKAEKIKESRTKGRGAQTKEGKDSANV